MAELTTDAEALSEAAASFDRITAGDLASALSGPAGDASSDDGNVDSFASTGDAGAAREANPFLKFKFETVYTTKIDWSGSGEHDTNDAFTAMEAGADGTETRSAPQNIQQISTFQCDSGPRDDDGFDFKAMESGEAASADTTDQDFALVIYNANHACVGDACNGGNAGILFGDGGDGLNFDGKFLMARDLIRDQGIVVDAGFDLI